MNKSHAQVQYDKAIEYLDDNFAYFLTHILNMGSPEWVQGLGATRVMFNSISDVMDGQDRVKFQMDPDIISEMEVDGVAFLISHEAMHLILNHVNVLHRFPDPELAILAADIVIEDYLASSGLEPIDDTLRGETWLGYDCAHLGVTYVYEELETLKEDNPDMFDALKDGVQQARGGHGEVGEEGSSSCEWLLEGDLAGQVSGQVLADSVGDVQPQTIQDLKQDEAPGGPKSGVGHTNNYNKLADAGITLKWADLMEKVDPDIYRTRGIGKPMLGTFRRSPKKLAAIYPEIILPNYERDEFWDSKTDELPMIVMAIDVSGSISEQHKSQFRTLAKSIPQDRVKIKACSFSTSYYPIDTETWLIQGGGGTDFNAIEKFIQTEVVPENKGKYPKAVMVMTDGEAPVPRVSKENQDAWNWLLISGGWYQSETDPKQFMYNFFGWAERLDKFII